MTTSPIWGHAPAERIKTKFGIRGRMADVIICFKFYRNRLRGFRAVRGQKGGFPLTLTVALTTGQHSRAACDITMLNRQYLQLISQWIFLFAA